MRQSLGYLAGSEGRGAEPDGVFPVADAGNRRSHVSYATPVIPDEATHRKRTSLPSWFIAASIAFVAGTVVAVIADRSKDRIVAESDEDSRLVQPAASMPKPFLAEGGLGKITGLSLEASAEGLTQSMQVGQELRCGEVVQLSKGFIRIQLLSGAVALIEGPAEFSIIGEETVFLGAGKLAAKSGKRLLLQTSLLSAECSHAEIVVEVADEHSASIYVSRGLVTLVATPQRPQESNKLQQLHANEGVVAQRVGGKDALRLAAQGPLPDILTDWSQVEDRLTPYQRRQSRNHNNH
jgi:hypothetical protein